MTEILEKLQQATGLLVAISGTDRTLLSDNELCALLDLEEAAGRLIDASRAQTAAEVSERSRFELGSDGLSMRHGHRKPAQFIEQVTRVSQAEALRRIWVGAAIRLRRSDGGQPLPSSYPAVASAVVSGDVGLDAAASIIRFLEQAAVNGNPSAEQLHATEVSLVDTALFGGVDSVGDAARQWRETLDPAGATPRHEEILRRRGLVIGRERNGITPIRINADPQTRALIQTALADSTVPGAVPRFMSEEERLRGTETVTVDGSEVEIVSDRRTRAHKQFDIFVGVFLAGIRASHDAKASLKTTGSVTAVVTLREMADGVGVGWLDGVVVPVPASVVREMVCDAGLRIMVLGDAGEPLYLGRRERLFTGSQRRALAVRDGGCVGPGCTAPPSWCHAHHVRGWAEGGSTDVDNGVLLCPAHHHALHAGAFEMRMIDGKPQLRMPTAGSDWVRVGRTRAVGLAA